MAGYLFLYGFAKIMLRQFTIVELYSITNIALCQCTNIVSNCQLSGLTGAGQ